MRTGGAVSVRERLTKGLAALIYQRAVVVGGQVLAVPVFLTRWGAAGYGEWVALTALASYLSYTNIGVPGAVRADMAMAHGRDDQRQMVESFQTSFVLVGALSGAAGLLFLAAMTFLPVGAFLKASFMSPTEAALVGAAIAVQVVLYICAGVMGAALSAVGKYALAGMLDSNRQLLEFLSIVVLVGLLHLRPPALAIAYPAISLGYFIALVVMLKKHAPWLLAWPLRFRWPVLRRLLGPMFGVLGMTLGYYGMALQAPRVILAATLGPKAVAVYAVTVMMLRMVRIPIEVPAHSATVEISLAYGKGDVALARRLLLGTTRFCLWLALALIPFVLLFGPFIVRVWGAGRLEVSHSLILFSAISTAFFAMALPFQEALMSLNRLGRVTVWILLGSPAYIAIAWLLTRAWGLSGAGEAVMLLDCAYAILSFVCITRYFDYPAAAFLKGVVVPPIDTVRHELAIARTAVASAYDRLTRRLSDRANG